MSSIRPQAFTGGLKDILNLDKDTREVSINGNRYVAGGEKPTGFFSSLTMAFRCFFRSDEEVRKNNAVFEQVKKNINDFYGEPIANKFNDEMQSKIDMGSPLTKGALMRFLNQQELSSLKPSEASTTTVTTAQPTGRIELGAMGLLRDGLSRVAHLAEKLPIVSPLQTGEAIGLLALLVGAEVKLDIAQMGAT